MYVNNARTVSEALSQGLHWLRVGGIRQDTRVGSVIVSPNPVLTVYKNPLNRVILSPMRDANPFFHVMEALWMLAGRNDLPWLTQFNSKFAAYSDDGGKTQPGAYGYRWRNHFGYDQLETIIVELKNNPQTRRCVLTMWDGGQVKDGGVGDLFQAIGGSNDVPCNTHVYFDTIDGRLNMTVCCRSNDVLWGAYGANAVHFSFLLEYMSAMTGIPMGQYRQFSNNFHLYTRVVPEEGIMALSRDAAAHDPYLTKESHRSMVYVDRPVRRVSLVTLSSPTDFKDDLEHFLNDGSGNYGHQFFSKVARPMQLAWEAYKEKNYSNAIYAAEQIRAEDWRMACVQWLARRQQRAEQNNTRFTDIVGEQA